MEIQEGKYEGHTELEGKQDDGRADWVQVKPMREEQTTTKDNKRTQNSQKQSYNRKFIRINQHVAEMCTRINTKRHDSCSGSFKKRAHCQHGV